MAATTNKGEGPSLAANIMSAIEGRLAEVHVSMPGRVEKYDAETQKADIQPLLQRKFSAAAAPMDLPVITNVPVKWNRTKDAIISLPLKPGDTGTILFHERSIDRWLSKGGIVSPDDPRKHSLSDAEFLPGLYPFSEPGMAEEDNILIRNDKAVLRLFPDGKFQVKSTQTSEELFDLLIQLCQAILDARTNTIFGPQPLINLANQFFVIKGKLEAMKGEDP